MSYFIVITIIGSLLLRRR